MRILFYLVLFVTVVHADESVEQACAYYADQNEEAAYRCYLGLLDELQGADADISEHERPHYEAALQTYLSTEKWRERCVNIHQKFAPILEEHPNYHALGLFVAVSHANLGQLDEFLAQFIIHARKHPKHFLVSKVEAILSVKLMEKGRSPAERDPWRRRALQALTQGLEKRADDRSMLQLAFSIVKDEGRVELLESCEKLGIAVPRKGIVQNVQYALSTGKVPLARQILDRARATYHYSRALGQAEKLLKEQEGES